MAALVAGVQYGLSSHSNFHENKSLIFVKLTDSAQRAIEDYLRNRNKTSQNPTIQFLGNEGQLSFPSSQHNHGSTGFTFSLSSNHDIEGPQGAFECVQQTGPKNLESLGNLPCKMRIQANDDVYETTRHRMAVAEENSKNKCTRVIKANGPDIGRKIKVKATGRTIPPPTTSSSSSSSSSSTNVRHRESLSIPTTARETSRLNYNSNTSSMSSSTNSSSLLSSSLASSSHKSMGTNGNPPLRTQQNKKMPELTRRPLKERLIHVLALRPYKKPELYDRIIREGVKERDRSTMSTILKQVAYMHDNTYHLHLYIWNDIQEDWPFYSEQDRAMLKRRKPQNLTPPGSSDGSSGSGQSPNSMHPGSPPAIIAPPPSLINSKRPGYYQGNDGLQTKRPRISHYRKPESTTRTSAGSYNSNSSTNNNTNSGHGLSGTMSTSSMINSNETANWEHQQQSRQHQRDRSDYRIEKIERNERTANSDVLHGSYTTIAKPCLTPISDCDENVTTTTTTTTTNINNYNYNNNNNGNRYGNISSSSSSAAAAAASSLSLTTATTVSSHSSSTSINSNNNLYNSGTTSTMRHNNNVFNGNDKVSSVVNSGNCDGVGVFDYMRSVGGNINKNINNNSVSVGGGGSGSSSSSSMNNGGNNRGFGASPCNGGVIEARRGDFRDGRNNDKERGGDREKRELNNKNFGSATDGIDSYKIKDSSANYGVCNNYIGSNGHNSSSVVPTTSTAIASTSTAAGSPITFTPASPTVTSSDAETSEYPDYLTQYTAINNTEQRRSYKAEFNSDYEEYRRLHSQIADVSKRFADLEEQRQRELEIGNEDKGLELRELIVAEYITTRNDPAHIETKRRFHYLHEKLSHIKRLVLEYDTEHFGPISDDMSNNGDDILGGSGDLQY